MPYLEIKTQIEALRKELNSLVGAKADFNKILEVSERLDKKIVQIYYYEQFKAY